MFLEAAGQLETSANLQPAEAANNRDPPARAEVRSGRTGLEDRDRVVVGLVDVEHLIERALDRLSGCLLRRAHSSFSIAEAEPT